MAERSIVHVEIPASDRDAAAKFYHGLFGWDYQHITEPSPYTMFQAGDTAGGITEVTEMSKVGDIRVYIGSDDVAADLQKAESLGGKAVVQSMEIPGYGTIGIFSDPTGNLVGLFKSV
jgi:predicted enzyme related to lactoylglutathione lyase